MYNCWYTVCALLVYYVYNCWYTMCTTAGIPCVQLLLYCVYNCLCTTAGILCVHCWYTMCTTAGILCVQLLVYHVYNCCYTVCTTAGILCVHCWYTVCTTASILCVHCYIVFCMCKHVDNSSPLMSDLYNWLSPVKELSSGDSSKVIPALVNIIKEKTPNISCNKPGKASSPIMTAIRLLLCYVTPAPSAKGAESV